MAIGRVGSFATDRPLEDAIGPAIKYNEQMAFKYREEAEKKKEKRKEHWKIIQDNRYKTFTTIPQFLL